MDSMIPKNARAIIVGGGIVGCSVAYHLAKLGWQDVVLLEQGELAGGTTWHAAGLVGRLRTSNSMTKINKYSAELYAGLEAETGQPTGWNQVGSLVVGTSADRMIQLRRSAAMAGIFGVDVHVISPRECVELWPLMRGEDILGGVWLPHDGKVVPQDLCLALAKGARDRGIAIHEGVRVLSLDHSRGRIVGVTTAEGEISAEHVVLCGGMWTRELARRCGIVVPLHPVEHHYVVSAPIAGVHDDLPVARDPNGTIYFRSKGDRIVLGAFQARSIPWNVDVVPPDFSFQLLEPDWDKYKEPLEAGLWRIPTLRDHELPEFVNGPESFTPDNSFVLGEAPGLRGCFVAAGFNSVGIASAGGAGQALAEWMTAGSQTMDLWSVDIRRFAPFHNELSFLRERSGEVLGLHYEMAWPNRELVTSRGVRKSALYDKLKERGACFGSKMGWERANWFAPPGVEARTEYSFGRQNWHEYSGAEHRAAREAVAIFDQSSFSKYLFAGRDALNILQLVCGNDIDVPVGGVVYTGLFNPRGTFESDLTVVRLEEQRFYIITATTQTVRDADWIARNTPDSADARLDDVTDEYGVLGLMGPNSRALLERVTTADISHAAFPFGTAREIDLGPVKARALRITYVGELGWELHIKMADLAAAYDALTAAGADLGLRDAGQTAINSLRLEKGYRAWGHELSPDDTPLEAGLGFAVAWDKQTPFLGREALLVQKQTLLKKRMAQFLLHDPLPMLWGSEPILRNGQPVGYTTSGAYGHTLGAAIALGYINHPDGVTPEFIRTGSYEIVIAGDRFSADVHMRTPYDPARKRILV